MPRLARAVAVGFAHHITQRGNNRQDVFFVDDDRRVYLELLKAQADKEALEVVGYCLMSNHVHLVAIPQSLSGDIYEQAFVKMVAGFFHGISKHPALAVP
jgi:putative transposase